MTEPTGCVTFFGCLGFFASLLPRCWPLGIQISLAFARTVGASGAGIARVVRPLWTVRSGEAAESEVTIGLDRIHQIDFPGEVFAYRGFHVFFLAVERLVGHIVGEAGEAQRFLLQRIACRAPRGRAAFQYL